MSSIWTINGQPTDTLGVENLIRTRRTMAADTLTCTIQRPVDTAVLPFGATVTLAKSGVTWFSGAVTRTPAVASGSSEEQAYEVQGGWYYLERVVFLQSWKTGVTVTVPGQPDAWGETVIDRSRVILGQASDGTWMLLTDVIKEIVNRAIAGGAPLALGAVPALGRVPAEEIVDITCAEALLRVLRWAPQVTSCMDYSTSPPTLNFYDASAPSVTLALTNLDNFTVTPRPDLRIPGYTMLFERTDSIDGDQRFVTTAITVGALGLGHVVSTLRLAGLSISGSPVGALLQRQHIRVANLPDRTVLGTDAMQAWWAARSPEFAAIAASQDPAIHIHDLTVAEGADPDAQLGAVLNLPRELREGSIQDWMLESSPGHKYHLIAQQQIFSVLVDYDVWEDDEDDENGGWWYHVTNKQISVRITATTAFTRTYDLQADADLSVVNAEPIPTGLPATLFAAYNRLWYDGSLAIVGPECVATLAPGMRLNVSGGLAEWASMNSPLQSVVDNIDDGRTEATIGHPSHLTSSDLSDILRCNRTRGGVRSQNQRASSDLSASAPALQFGSHIPVTDTASTEGKSVKAQEIVTDVRFDPGTSQIQVKTRKVGIVPILAADESDWTMIEGGQAEICDDSESA